ncbi:MAG: hypothetical protein WA657_22565 [Candidatus Acidiferrales bacterium]
MNVADDAQQKIETYLASVRRHLRGFNDAEVGEVVEELRSHITDKIEGSRAITAKGVDATLAALGRPEELAAQFVTENLLARTEVSRSPLRILIGLFRWASLSFGGFLVLLGSLAGYFFGIVFVLCALLKPLHPQTAGLWATRDSTGDLIFSLRLGFGTVLPGGKDVLGWWIVPIGLLVGCGLIMLTTRVAVWCVRRCRKPSVLPRD